jgi:hypothetical protein
MNSQTTQTLKKCAAKLYCGTLSSKNTQMCPVFVPFRPFWSKNAISNVGAYMQIIASQTLAFYPGRHSREVK